MVNTSDCSSDPEASLDSTDIDRADFVPPLTSTQLSDSGSAQAAPCPISDDAISAFVRNIRENSHLPAQSSDSAYLHAGTNCPMDPDNPPLNLTSRPSLDMTRGEGQGLSQEDVIEQYGISPSAYLYAVQEPCVFLQKIINISGATVIMDSKAEVVRAAIVCSTHLNMWPAREFCSGDMVTAILKTKKHGEIYVVSLYCDIELKPVPDLLKALQTRARKEKKQLLILGDVNSHSSACWNSKSTNARGKVWEKFISD